MSARPKGKGALLISGEYYTTRLNSSQSFGLGKDLLNDMAFHIGEPSLDPIVEEG
jgi:hypothetical protein